MKINRILIVRPDAIGDFVIFSAVLNEYGKLFKDSKIDLLCHPKVKELVQPIPFINKIICINTQVLFGRRYFVYTLLSLIKIMRFKYEKVIYPAYSRTGNDDLLIKFIRAKEKIAFDGNNTNDPKNERISRNKYFSKIIESDKKERLEIERNAEFLIKLGINIDINKIKTKIWFSDNDEMKYKKLKEKYKLEQNKYICTFPGAGVPTKYWENGKWAELINKMIDKYHTNKIVILGYTNDIVVINGILDLLHIQNKEKIINLYNKTSLRVLAKVIQNSNLLVGMDTAAIHIAAALNTPNVCLIGGKHFGRFYPYGDLNKNKIVYKKMNCFGCNRRWCKYEIVKCIKDIEVKDVWNEIITLMMI